MGEIASKAVVQVLFSTGKRFTVDGLRHRLVRRRDDDRGRGPCSANQTEPTRCLQEHRDGRRPPRTVMRMLCGCCGGDVRYSDAGHGVAVNEKNSKAVGDKNFMVEPLKVEC